MLNSCCTMDSPSREFNACVDPPATNDRMIFYYCLVTEVDLSLAIVRYFPGRVVAAGIRAIACTRA
jgi:hypothetical protein